MQPSAYSISLRVQRTTVEYGYVRVPVTDDIMEPQDDQGRTQINPEKLVQRAVELSQSERMVWYPESQ